MLSVEAKLVKNFSKKRIVIILVIIGIISLSLKLYTVDFSIPPHGDDFVYVIDAIQYNEGDFFLSQKKHPGWPLALAPFIKL